ncbi:MAG: branched-chain amino acid ABC transporter permease [Rhodospirillales bacterium]|nr:branched-chain amino acid ABC transporter permease [Rhodospirillales bacterium]
MLGNIDVLLVAPIFNVQLLLDGLLIGGVFALAAYGLALVWGVMNVKNLAQGDFVMIGGYITWYLAGMGMHPLLGVPIAFVALWGFGWVTYKLVVAHVIDRDLFTSLLATFGIAIVIEQVLNILFGSDTQTADAGFSSLPLFGGTVSLPLVKLIGFGLAAALAVAVVLFMKHSRTGQAIRATAQDPRAARVMGIDIERVYSFTFALNAAICGAAGALVAMIWVIQPFYGITYSIRSFVVVVAAGLGNLPGVIGAGLGIGVAEQFGGFVLGAEFQQVIVVGLLLLVLIVRQLLQARKRQAVQ